MTMNPHLAAAQGDINAYESLLASRASEIEGLQRTVQQTLQQLQDVTDEFAAYKAANPPKAQTTFVGACPQRGLSGFNLPALQGVVDRFGDGAAVRAFESSSSLTVAPRPAAAGHVHASWPLGITARPTVDQIKAACVNLKPGDAADRNHEADMKVRNARYTLTNALAALADWAPNVKEARPDLLTVITLTGWLFSPAASAPGLSARNAWGPTAGLFDVTCVDLDGIHSWPYPNYLKHIPNILKFLDDYGIDWFAVPELGWSQNTTNDPDDSIRAEKLAEITDALEATGRCKWVDAYVYNSTAGNDFTAVTEAAWRERVARTA